MAIKGITVEIGGNTTGLNKALSSVNKTLNSTQKELNDVNRLLKVDPTNVELLTQKQELLTKKITDTKLKVNALKSAKDKADKDMANGTEVNQEQYRKLIRQIANAEQSLDKLESEAKDTEKALSGISDDCTKGLDRISDESDKAAKSLKNIEKSAKFTAAVEGAELVVDGIKSIASAAKDAIEGTREYRREIGFLKTNCDSSGVSFEEVEQKLNRVSAITDDSGAAIEGFSNLLEAGFSGEKLDAITNNLVGASIKWKDTLKFEGLSDGLQETLATGTATGPFGEMLERMGMDLDVFNEELANCSTQAEKQDLVLNTLAQSGLTQVKAQYEQQNATLIDSAEKQAELNSKVAEMAEKIEPVLTKVTEIVIAFIDWINQNPELATALGITAAALFVVATAIGVINAVMMVSPVTWIVLAIVAAIGALIAIIVLCVQHWDQIKQTAINCWNAICDAFKAAGDWFMNTVVNPIKNAFKICFDFIVNILKSVGNFFIGIANGWLSAVEMLINGIISAVNFGISTINSMLSGISSVLSFVGINVNWSIPSISKVSLPRIPYLAKGGHVLNGSAIVGEAGPELLTVGKNGTTVTPLTNNEKAIGAGQTFNITFSNFNNYDTEKSANQIADIVEQRISFKARRATV